MTLALPTLWTPRRRLWRPPLIHKMGRLFNANGWIFGSGGGKFFADAGSPACQFFEALLCSDNSHSGVWIRGDRLPASGAAKRNSDGICYTFDNICNPCKTDTFGTYTSITGCADVACSTTPAPCACGFGGPYASIYTVAGFAGLTCGGTCDAGTDPAWMGALNRVGTTCVWWAADLGFAPLSYQSLCALDITYTQILLNTTLCQWELYIACYSATHPSTTMWAGVKTTGLTPAGTYSGGPGPATMTVS